MHRMRQQSPEQRGECRLNACISVTIRILGAPVPAVTRDISASGIRAAVRSPQRFSIGASYPLQIQLPGSARPIHATASVSRVRPPVQPLAGTELVLEFTEIAEEEQARIAEFICRRQIQNRKMGLG